MTTEADVKAKVREALQNPDLSIRSFLTALHDANDFITRSDLEKDSGLGGRYIAAVKSNITKRLTKTPGPPLSADDLFYQNGRGDLRLRPELWTVVGEVLGRRKEISVTGTKVAIRSVSRTSIDRGSIVNFEIDGIANSGTRIAVSVSVPDRSGNTRQSVERACDILRARLTALAKSAESLKENLSQWD